MNKKIIIGSIIVIAAAGLITAGILKNPGTSETFGSGSKVEVKTAKIQKGDISSYVSCDGKVEEVEKAEIFFDTPLKVKRVFVKVGQKVTKGQQLFELDEDSLTSQLKTQRVNRKSQQISMNSKALDQEVERTFNNLKAAERTYNDCKKTYEENFELYKANAITKIELDQSQKNLTEAESGMNGLKNAKIAYDSAVENRDNNKKSSQETIKLTDLQISDLEKKISQVKRDSASPMNGVVTSLGVEEGAFTNTMQAACSIINPDKLQIRAKVKEFDIKNIKVGQKTRVSGDAIEEGKEITGIIKSIAPVAVSNATTSGNETVVEVLVEVHGAGEILKPGLNVTCDISAFNKKDVLLVPMDAITPDKDDNNMVFVVDEKTSTMKQHKVKIGINSEMSVEVLDGLREGDLVVLDPQASYKDGMGVKISK
jgi:RND family efflux transporter MFP subunit